MTDIFESLNNGELDRNNLPVDNGRKIDLVDLIYEGRRSTPIASTTDAAFPERLRSGTKDLDFFPEEDREDRISLNTSGWEQAGQAIYNTAVEATVGTLEGAALLPGVDSLLGAIGESETGYGNFLSDVFADVKEGMKSDVYQTQQAREGFAPMDGSWWASNADTLASTLTLMIPAMGMTKLLGAVGKMSKMAAMRNGLVTTETLINNANAINKIEKVGSILGASAIQRWTENTMEAQGTFEDTYQSALQMGMSDEVAREKAGNAAAKTWGAGWLNMAQDVIQFGTIGKGIGKFSSRAAKTAAANKKGFLKRGAGLAGVMASEALEEADQYIISQEAKKSELNDDYKFSGLYDRLVNDYVEDPEFHTSMFFGALGGGVFKGIGDAVENYSDKRTRKVIDERKQKIESQLNDDYIKDAGIDTALIFNKTMAYIELEALDDLKENIDLELMRSDAELINEGKNESEIEDYRKKLKEAKDDIDFIADTYSNSNNRFRDPLVVRTEVAMEYALRKVGKVLHTVQSEFTKLTSESLAADAKQEQLTRIEDINRINTLKGLMKALDQVKDDGSAPVKNPEELKAYVQKRIDTLTKEVGARLPDNTKIEDYLKHDKDTAISNGEQFNLNIRAQEQGLLLMEDFKYELELTRGNKVEILAERDRKRELNKTKRKITENKISVADIQKNGILEDSDPEFSTFINDTIEAQDTTDLPIGDNREAKINNRYKGKNLLFAKELKEMSESGISVIDIADQKTFSDKYKTDTQFRTDVDNFYDAKAKTTGEFFDSSELIGEGKEDVDIPETYGVIGNVGQGVQNLIDSLQYALVRLDAEDKNTVVIYGINGLSTMPLSEFKEKYSTKFLYGKFTPLYDLNGKLIPNQYNEFIDVNGNRVQVVSDDTYALLNSPDIELYDAPVRYRVYPDHPDFSPAKQPNGFLIGVEVQIKGEWRTVGRLTAKQGEKFARSIQVRKAVLKEYNKTKSETIDLGSKITTKQNGFIRRIPGAKNSYETVLGKNAILGVIMPSEQTKLDIHVGKADVSDIVISKDSNLLKSLYGDTVVLVQRPDGVYTPVKLRTKKAHEVKDKNGVSMAQKAVDLLEAYHVSDHSEEALSELYSKLDRIIYLRIQRTKEGKYKLLKHRKGKGVWSAPMSFSDVKEHVMTVKAMRVDASRINNPAYNKELQDNGILETDIAPDNMHISTSVAIDLFIKDTRTEEEKAADAKKQQEIKVPQKKIDAIEEGAIEVIEGMSGTVTPTMFSIDEETDELAELNKVLDNGPLNKESLEKQRLAEVNAAAVKVEEELTGEYNTEDEYYDALNEKLKPILEQINAKYAALKASVETSPTENIDQTEEEETSTFEDDGKDDFDDVDFERARTVKAEESSAPMDESEKEWFKKYYPSDDPKIVDDLSTVTKKGGSELYGLYKNGVIYLTKNSARGTLYHEAFHLVFNSMLTDAEQQAVLAEQRKDRKGKTDIDIEEELADKYMDVRLTGGEIINTFTGKIKDFFKRLWNIAQIFLERNNLKKQPSIDQIFYRTNRGLYNSFPRFKRNVSRFRQHVYGDLSRSEAKMASQIIATNILNNLVGVSLRKAYNMPDAELTSIIKKAQKLKSSPKRKKGEENFKGYDFNDLILASYNKMKKILPELNEVDRNNLTRVLNALVYFDETGKPTLRELRNLVAGELQTFGIKVDVSNMNSTVDESILEDDEGVTEDHADESFDFKDSFNSSLKDFRGRSRVLFASIKNTERSFAGFPLYHNPATVYNTLKKALESSLSQEEMLIRLDELYNNHPDYEIINEFFEKDRTLITEFFKNFGQRNNTPFIRLINDVGNTTTVFESNRSNIASDLRADWYQNFITESEYYDPSTGKIKPSGINIAKKNLEIIDKLFSELKTRKTLSAEQASTLASVLYDAGIRVDRNVFIENISKEEKAYIARRIFVPSSGKGLRTFFDLIAKNVNPFEISDLEEGTGASVEMSKALYNISRTVSAMFPEMRSSMFQNGKGKSVDSNLLPRDSMRRLLMWKKNPDMLLAMGSTDPFWSQSEFLGSTTKEGKGIFYSNIQDIQLAILDSSEMDKGDHREYSELTAKNFHTTLINLFFNYSKSTVETVDGQDIVSYGQENKFGWFGMPIPSDSTAYNIIKFPKSTTSEAIEYIVDAVNNEYQRIQWIEKLIRDNQEAYDNWMAIYKAGGPYKTSKPEAFKDIPFNMLLNGRKFHSFSELNNGDVAKTFANEVELTKAVNDAYNEYRKRFFEDLVNKNVIELKDGKYIAKDGNLDRRISGTAKGQEFLLESNLNRFLANATLVNMQTAFLFAGDIANYKADKKTGTASIEDFFKRVKQINSPGTYLDPTAEFIDKDGKVIKGREKYKVAVVADKDGVVSDNLEKILEIQRAYAKTLDLTEKEVEEHLNFITKKYSDMNVTDAFTFIDPYRYREIAIQSAQWSMDKESVYQRMLNNDPIDPKEMEIFQPFKPFRYGIEVVNGIHVPTQHKNAEMLVTPQMALYNSVYRTGLEKMGYTFTEDGKFTFDSKGRDSGKYVDAVMYNSSVKVGELYTFADEQSIDPSVAQSFYNNDYRIQMGTPEHFVNAEINIGSQIRKLIMEGFDVNSSKLYNINGENLTGKQIIERYNDIMVANLQASYDNVRSIFMEKDGVTVNSQRMTEELKKYIIQNELGTDYLEAVDLIDGKPSIPYWYPSISYNLQSIFSAFYKNNITKQQMSGMALFNSSSVGFNATGALRKPNIVFKADGKSIDHIEALIPANHNFLMRFADPTTGLIDVKKVEEHDPRLLKGIFYRIPSEDKYSMVHIKVIGFLPNSSGAQIILPDEITSMAGLDFDIDKMFGMMYEVDMKTGKVIEPSMDSKKSRNNRMLDLMYGIMQLEETAFAQLSPGNFDNLVATKNHITKIAKEDTSLNFLSQISKVEVQQRNMMGKELIGVFANHRVNHILFTFGEFKLKEPISFGKHRLTSLSLQKSPVDRKMIGKRLATFVAAVVDNAKDPIASMLNLVPFLADVAAMMIRVGYSDMTAALFLKQKVFVDLTQDYTNSSEFGAATVRKLLNQKMKDLQDTHMFSDNVHARLDSEQLTDGMMEENLRNPSPEVDMMLIKRMIQMYDQADSLRKMMSTMRYDSTSKAAGPTYFDTEANVLEYGTNAVEENDFIEGYGKFMNNPLIDWVRKFYSLGVERSLADMKMVMDLPYDRTVFADLKSYMNLWKPQGSLKAKDLNMLINAVFTMNAYQFGPIADVADTLIKTFPDRFQQFKNENPKYSMLTGLITVEQANNEKKRLKAVPIKMLKFNRQGLTPNHIQSIRDEWTTMMESTDANVRQFAQDLAIYTFMTSGFMFRKNSMNDAIPITWMTSMVNAEGVTFLEHMENMNNVSKLSDNQKKEIVRNLYQSFDIFPNVELKDAGIEVTYNKETKLYEGTIEDTSRDFRKQIDKKTVYTPYIRLTVDGDIRLLEHVAMKGEEPFYREITPLGIHNRYVQFSKESDLIINATPVNVSKIKEQGQQPISKSKVNRSMGFSELKSLVAREGSVYTSKGVYTMRTSGNEHFGNPFTGSKVPGLIQMKDIPTAVKAYMDWLTENDHKNVNPEQRQWIIGQINAGNLNGKDLLYMKEKGDYYSHAHALSDMVNDRVQQPITETIKTIIPTSISEITNHSGGAIGSDTQWDIIGKEFGMVNNKHYWTESKTPLGNSEISKEDFEEGRYESAKAAKRNFGYQYQTMKDSRLIRNWSQVKYSDAIFAIGKIVDTGEKLFPKQSYDTRVATNPSVTGGTGYAVGMGINHNKPVYVFNQSASQKYSVGWYEWSNDSKDFVKTDIPILTKDFAGIGTREINDLGKQAIRDTYQKFLNQLKGQETLTDNEVDTNQNKINIYAGTGENAELSNFANRPFVDEGIGDLGMNYKEATGKSIVFNTVEGFFQASKIIYSNSSEYWDQSKEAWTLTKKGIELIEKFAKATGSEAKSLGRTIKELDTKEWDKYSLQEMEGGLLASFEQNPDALAKLLATGNATLTHTQDKGKWGTEFPRLLMEVREELRNFSQTVMPELLDQTIEPVTENVSKDLIMDPVVEIVDTPSPVVPSVKETKKEFEYKGIVIDVEIDLSQDQINALKGLIDFAESSGVSPQNYKTLVGPAGTGKTTIIAYLEKYLKKKGYTFNYMAPTHAATVELAFSIVKTGNRHLPATVRSSITLNSFTNKWTFSAKMKKRLSGYKDIVIVDESSMLDNEDAKVFLEAAKNEGVKVVFMGDPMQIPKPDVTNPKKKNIPFIFGSDNAFKLTTVHRQKSGDMKDILTRMRGVKGYRLFKPSKNNERLFFTSNMYEFNQKMDESFQEYPDNTIFISYTNSSVKSANVRVRSMLGRVGQPVKGDILMGYLGYGSYQIEKKQISNSMSYKIEDVTRQGSYFILKTYSAKLDSLIENGIATISTPIASASYYPLSDSDSLKFDDMTNEDYAANNSHVSSIMKKLFVAEQAYKTKQLPYSNYLSVIERVTLEMSEIYLGDSYVYNPVNDRMEKYNPSDPAHRGIKTSGNGSLLVEKGLDYGHAITIHKSQGSTHKNVFFDSSIIKRMSGIEIMTPEGDVLTTEAQTLAYVGMSRASDSLTVYESDNEFETVNVQSVEPITKESVKEYVSLQMSIGKFLADQKEKSTMTLTEAVDSFEEYDSNPTDVPVEGWNRMTLDEKLAHWFAKKNC